MTSNDQGRWPGQHEAYSFEEIPTGWACVLFSNYAKRPYLVVSQDWFDRVERELFSLYALVDMTGTRAPLESKGRIDASQASRLRLQLDQLAATHSEHAFLSFADSVLVKANWSARDGEYDRTYMPERFLAVTGEICSVIRDVLGMGAYSIITQGANLVEDPDLLHVSPVGNHIFFGSLATPFAELYDIETAARRAIRDGSHPRRDLYLSKSFFLTLQLAHSWRQDALLERLVPFKSKVTSGDESAYLPVDRAEITQALRR